MTIFPKSNKTRIIRNQTVVSLTFDTAIFPAPYLWYLFAVLLSISKYRQFVKVEWIKDTILCEDAQHDLNILL